MAKKAIFVVLDAVLFLLAYAIGSVLPGLGKMPMWSTVFASGRLFVWDGIVLMLLCFVVIVVVQAVRKTLQTRWGTPVLALVLSLLLLAAMRFPLAMITPTGPATM